MHQTLNKLRVLLDRMLGETVVADPLFQKLAGPPWTPSEYCQETPGDLLAFLSRCYQRGGFVTPPADADEITFHWPHAGQFYVPDVNGHYFVHPDLDRFLRRELDRYIKDDILPLMSEKSAARWRQCLRRGSRLRRAALPIIRRLARREEERKRKWLRPRAVWQTAYCLPLHQIPESFYPEIAANQAQQHEWQELFDLDGDGSAAFLRAHPHLPVDTALFSADFTARLLASLRDVDACLCAIALHGDSFHGLAHIRSEYAGRIDTIYIDPPFNTDNDEFLYKNDYDHSAWLTLMDQLLRQARPLLSPDGSLFAQIDHHEAAHLKMLLSQVFGAERFVNEIIWRRKQATSYSRKQLGIIHDTIWWFANSASHRFVPHYTRHDAHTRRYVAERFVYVDEATGRRYMKSPLVNSMYRPNLKFEFHGVAPPPNGWLYSRARMEELFRNGELVLPDKPGGRIYRKIFEDTYPGQRIQNLWLDIPIVNPMAHERIEGFATQKPAALIERIFAMSTGPDSWVLDFFAGSGTAFQAVLDLNRKDNGRRRIILMEKGDHFDTIMLPRMKRLLADRPGTGGFKYLRLEKDMPIPQKPGREKAKKKVVS